MGKSEEERNRKTRRETDRAVNLSKIKTNNFFIFYFIFFFEI